MVIQIQLMVYLLIPSGNPLNYCFAVISSHKSPLPCGTDHPSLNILLCFCGFSHYSHKFNRPLFWAVNNSSYMSSSVFLSVALITLHTTAPRDIYCATEAISGLRLLARFSNQTRPDQPFIQRLLKLQHSHRSPRRAAMFSCRAAWQRCGPVARRAAYRLPRDGEFHQPGIVIKYNLSYTKNLLVFPTSPCLTLKVTCSLCHLSPLHLNRWSSTLCPRVNFSA